MSLPKGAAFSLESSEIHHVDHSCDHVASLILSYIVVKYTKRISHHRKVFVLYDEDILIVVTCVNPY